MSDERDAEIRYAVNLMKKKYRRGDDGLVPHFFRAARGRRVFDILYSDSDVQWFSVDNVVKYPVIRDYVVRTGKQYRESDDLELGTKFIRILRDVISTAPAGIHWLGTFLVEILANIPIELISTDDIDKLAVWIRGGETMFVGHDIADQLLPRFLESPHNNAEQLCMKLVEVTTEITCKPSESKVFKENAVVTPVDDHTLFEMLLRPDRAARLGPTCGLPLVRILRDRLLAALDCNPSKDRWSTIWRSAIAEDPRNRSHLDICLILTLALRDAIVGSAAHPRFKREEAEEILQEMLDGRSSVLRRVAVHVCDFEFGTFGHLVSRRIGHRLFGDEIRPEMYRFLDHHFADLTVTRQAQVLKTIERLESKDDSEFRERRTNVWRQTWLSAIKGKGNKEADRLYDDYRTRTGIEELDHPDLSTFMSGVFTTVPTSPVSAEGMLQLTISNLVDFLNDFRAPARTLPTDGREISVRGVQEALQKAVETKPEHFWTERKSIANLDVKYVASVLRGFTEIWKRGGELEWESVLGICRDRLREEIFANTDEDSTQFAGEIARLIREGTIRDENPLTYASALHGMEEILSFALRHQISYENVQSEDAVLRAMNCARGSLMEALFLYTRRLKLNLGDKADADFPAVWTPLELLYGEQLDLDGSSRDYEFRALACSNAPLLLYVGGSWFTDHIDEIFPTDNAPAWRAAMDGYTYVTTVYEVLYRPLRDRGHLWKALQEDRYRERILQQVAVAYTAESGDWEVLDDEGSLIRRVLNRWRIDDIRTIVTFFWRHRSAEDLTDESERLKEPAIRLWHWCYENVPKDASDRGQIIAELAELAAYLDDINEGTKRWLVDAAKSMNDSWSHAHQLVRELVRLADALSPTPGYVADVFLAFLDGDRTPPYPDDDVRTLMTKLAIGGLRDQVRSIRELYARKGIDPDRLG